MKSSIFKFLFAIMGIALMFVVPASAAESPAVFIAPALLVVAYFVPAKYRPGYIAGQVTQYGLQAAFQNARQQIYEANLPDGTEVGATAQQIQAAKNAAANAVLSQSNLKLIQPLTANLNLFNFPIQVDQPPVTAGEIRLQKQDAFFCSNIAFYIAKGASAADVSYEVQTYPDVVNWPVGAGAGGLFTVYNGELIITINKSIIVPGYPMLNFLQIPQTQNIAAVVGQKNQFDPSVVSLWEPSINLIGTKQNVFQLQLPANMTAAIEANTVGIFELQGVLDQNVTLFT